MPHTEELVELERAFWAAAGDGGFYREHFAQDGRCVFAMGVLDKAATIQAVAAASPWSDVDLDEVEEVDLGPGARALVYAASGRRAGSDAPYRARISSVYVQQDGAWRLALHQQTPIG